MDSFFITSIGTGIGKTLVTTALCSQLRQQGKKVTALKPIVSGFTYDDPESDPALILQSCGLMPTKALIDTISPWRFAAPIAPNMAALSEGKTIDLDKVIAYCRDHTNLKSDAVLLEGAGGVMAPISDQYTMLDWMEGLQWPVILVAGSYLGSLSHTLTAVEALRGRGVPVRALVISE
jgi:dethiobiotin synthetase